MALALEAYEAGCCPGCGNQIDEVWSATALREWDAERIQCGACLAMQRAEHRQQDEAKNASVPLLGFHTTAHRRGDTPMSKRLKPPTDTD